MNKVNKTSSLTCDQAEVSNNGAAACKETEFHCMTCDKYYASYKSYGNHIRSYHSKNREKAQCEYCGNSFTRKDNLQQHIRLFHSPVQVTFSCPFCGKNFTTRNSCSKHKKTCNDKYSYSHSQEKEKDINSPKPVYETKELRKRATATKVKDLSKENSIFPLVHESKSPSSNSSEGTLVVVADNFKRENYEASDEKCTKWFYDKFSNIQPQNDSSRYEGKTIMEYVHVHESNNNDIDVSRTRRKRRSNEVFRTARVKSPKIIFSDTKGEECESECECVSKALDCNICNITFLSEKDYNDHKPYCHNTEIP